MDYKRNIELDIMKFWGILLVVLGHVTNMYTPNGLIPPFIPSGILSYISYFVCQFHMPLFVFVSGAVYAYQYDILLKRPTFTSFVKKKVKRLLVPYHYCPKKISHKVS